MKKIILKVLFILFVSSSLYGQAIKQLKGGLADANRGSFQGQSFASTTLNKKDAKEAATLLLNDANARLRTTLQNQWSAKALLYDNDSLKFDYRIFGEKPKSGR